MNRWGWAVILIFGLLLGALAVVIYLYKKQIADAAKHKAALGAAVDAADSVESLVSDVKTIWSDLKK